MPSRPTFWDHLQVHLGHFAKHFARVLDRRVYQEPCGLELWPNGRFVMCTEEVVRFVMCELERLIEQKRATTPRHTCYLVLFSPGISPEF